MHMDHYLKKNLRYTSASTRFRNECQPTLLDLLFTSEEFMIVNLTYNPAIRKRSPLVLLFNIF